MSVDLAHIRQVMAEADCLYTEAQLEAAIDRVAQAINAELAERNPVVFCVMNGGLVFSGKLLPKLNFPLEQSYLHATRYRNETSGGELFWKAKPEISFIDRDVLIIDDILDEGHTLGAIIDFCKHAGASAVHTAVLIDKEHDRKARPNLKADYVGLTCIDRYIFGYGMDYKGYWRNAAGIYAVKGL
jgi:hypoxanthine phosphoribosyltransferase